MYLYLPNNDNFCYWVLSEQNNFLLYLLVQFFWKSLRISNLYAKLSKRKIQLRLGFSLQT